MNLSSRQRKILKVVGFVALALITFVFALAQTFPYDRLKDRLITELSDKYDVSIADIHSGWLPGTVIIEGFSLRSRPEKKDEKPTAIFVQEIEIDIGLFALIRQHYDVDVVATLAGSEVEVEVRMSESELDVSIHTEGLPLQSVPGVAGVVGLPMGGPLDADIRLEVPIAAKGKRRQFKWSEADGKVAIQCNGCTVGDGKAKLKMKPRSGTSARRRRRMLFAAEGITVPKLRLGNAVIDIDIAAGIGTINAFKAKSGDGELSLEGELRLAEPFKRSTLPGCMRFSLSDELKKREPNFGNIELTLPARSREDDGTFAIPTKGNLARFGLNHRRRCTGAGGGDASDRERPSISSRPKLTPRSRDDRTGSAATRGDDEDVTAPEPGTSGPSLTGERLRDVARKAADAKAHPDKEESGEASGEAEPAAEPGAEPDPEGTEEVEPEGGEVEGELEIEPVPDEGGGEIDEPVVE